MDEKRDIKLKRQLFLKAALRRLIDRDYKKIARFAEALAIQGDYVSRMLYEPGKAGGKNIGDEIITRISEIHPRWLDEWEDSATDDGQVAYRPASDLPPIVHRVNEPGAMHRIPKLNVAGGQGHGMLAPAVEYQSSVIEVTDDWTRENLPGIKIRNLRAVTGMGDSMMPTYKDGEILFVDTSVNELKHDCVFVFVGNADDQLFIKRVTRHPLEDKWSITSDNRELHPPLAMMKSLEEITSKLKVGGRVVGVWGFRRIGQA